jgi:hypothetical protein
LPVCIVTQTLQGLSVLSSHFFLTELKHMPEIISTSHAQ